MKSSAIIIFISMFCTLVFADEQVYRLDNTVVTYEGIEQIYAEAIGKTAHAARAIAAEKFGFDMPQTIKVNINCDPKQRVRLFTDGQDMMYLTIRRESDLKKPQESGIFHIYGICHETGHLAMYRIIIDHSWMSSDAAEGWAHYLGSRIVDGVYEKHKGELWPDKYDYLADGTARLNNQLADANAAGIVKGAGLWKDLAEIVGDKSIVEIFKAWSKAEIDPADPGAALRKALLETKEDERLNIWWNSAEPMLVFKRPSSEFKTKTAKRNELAQEPMDLFFDDGRQASKSSIAGSGHAVKFNIPGSDWYLTSVQIYGSRYGYPQAPKEDFHIWLCDKDFKTIADFPQPYAKFNRGNPKWVNLPVEPTNVPTEFVICVGFNPTGTKGVYVGYDAEGSGNSFTALPGGEFNSFSEGDWLIRVKVDQLKGSDALKSYDKK
jgi:hypothetical protein